MKSPSEGSAAVGSSARDYITSRRAWGVFSGARACPRGRAQVKFGAALEPLRLFGGSFGAATFIASTIAGQVLVSIMLDHFGVVGFAARPVTAPRLLCALLLIAGVLLVRKF